MRFEIIQQHVFRERIEEKVVAKFEDVFDASAYCRSRNCDKMDGYGYYVVDTQAKAGLCR